jgi:hypothetical protein
MNKSVGSKIGASLGKLEDVDIAGDGVGWGRYLRLRVTIDLSKPLDRGRELKMEGISHWVVFKYEKLPSFCFRCGRIVHDKKGCPVSNFSRRNNMEESRQWGPWLRAEESKRRGGGGSFTYRAAGVRISGRTEDEAGGSDSEAGSSSKKEKTGTSGASRQILFNHMATNSEDSMAVCLMNREERDKNRAGAVKLGHGIVVIEAQGEESSGNLSKATGGT